MRGKKICLRSAGGSDLSRKFEYRVCRIEVDFVCTVMGGGHIKMTYVQFDRRTKMIVYKMNFVHNERLRTVQDDIQTIKMDKQ